MLPVAFLGTGLMGAPMVRRLIGAGIAVNIWNRSPEKAVPLAAEGAVRFDTAAAAIRGVKTIGLCLTDGPAVEDILFGPSGIAAYLHPEAVIVDFSTIGPNATRELVARLAKLAPSVRWVDAPVTGGVKGAEAGSLVLLCGGDAADIEALRPMLEPLSKRICHLGPLGQGQAAKMCNQLIVAINVIAMAEAMGMARDQGLDITKLPDALEGGWADSLPFQLIGRRMAEGISEPKIVAIGTIAKDIGLALECSSREMGLASAAARIYRSALNEGLEQQDATALLPLLAG